jgi:hypothetical protein
VSWLKRKYELCIVSGLRMNQHDEKSATIFSTTLYATPWGTPTPGRKLR